MGKPGEHHDGHDTTQHPAKPKHKWFGTLKHAFEVKPGSSDASNLGNEGALGRHRPSLDPRTSSSSQANKHIPFGDDHHLEQKYGRAEQLLGAGSSGTVRVFTRSSDNKSFAVKQFRKRHASETKGAYTKKVMAEFSAGSNFHHGNIIETLDIFDEHGVWYQVMEYAPHQLIPTVLSGEMSSTEVACCTKQIFSGVSYMHSLGFAHRDLKLENIVLSSNGIIKLIDFGAAVMFRDPEKHKIIKTQGIEGTHYYIAPEILNTNYYEAQRSDVWSLAIIYFCMATTYFPWESPVDSDKEFNLFTITATSGHGDATSEHSSGVAVGPWRVTRKLPSDARQIITKMLSLEPKQRPSVDEVLQSSWLQGIPACSQSKDGEVHRAPGHEHILKKKQPK